MLITYPQVYVTSYFYRPPKALSLSRIFVECSVKPFYLTMVEKKISNSWCEDYWKMHLPAKNWSLDVFTHAHANPPLGSYHQPTGGGDYSFHRRQRYSCCYYVSIKPNFFSLCSGTNHLNGSSISHWPGLERFLFPFRTKRLVFYLALTSMNKFCDQRNHTELSISGAERNVSLSEAECSNNHPEYWLA